MGLSVVTIAPVTNFQGPGLWPQKGQAPFLNLSFWFTPSSPLGCLQTPEVIFGDTGSCVWGPVTQVLSTYFLSLWLMGLSSNPEVILGDEVQGSAMVNPQSLRLGFDLFLLFPPRPRGQLCDEASFVRSLWVSPGDPRNVEIIFPTFSFCSNPSDPWYSLRDPEVSFGDPRQPASVRSLHFGPGEDWVSGQWSQHWQGEQDQRLEHL